MDARTTFRKVTFSLLLIAGDVHPHPGPQWKFPCGVCDKPVKRNQKGIQCDNCDKWYHNKCCHIDDTIYNTLANSSCSWICCNCGLPSFSSSLFNSTLDSICSPNSFSQLTSSSSCDLLNGSTVTSNRQHQHSTLVKQQVPAPIHTKRKKRLRLMTINCRSLKSIGKQQQFAAIVDLHNPDIICGTESHLDDSIQTSEVFPNGYNVFRNDRTMDGGGVFVAVSEDLIATEVELHKECEISMVKIELVRCKPLYIGSFYRPTNNLVDPIEELGESLNNIFHNKDLPNVILAGDFNLPDINWQRGFIKPAPQWGIPVNQAMLNLSNDYSLTQCVHEPTRLNNILDLIFTTNPNLVYEVSVQFGMSDHDVAVADIDTKARISRKKPRQIFLYKKGNLDGLKQDLRRNFDEFEAEHCNSTTDKCWTVFKNNLLELMKKYIPTKVIKGKFNVPWFTKELRSKIRVKQRYYNRAKKTQNIEHWNAFKTIQSHIKNEMRKLHNKYISDLLNVEDVDIDKPDNQPSKVSVTSKFWRYIKSRKRDIMGITVLKDSKGKEVADDKAKAELLNEHYASIFTNEDKSNLPKKDTSSVPSIPNIQINTEGLVKLLNNINTRKANGPDGIPNVILKEAATEIAPFNSSFQSLSTPDHCLWTG